MNEFIKGKRMARSALGRGLSSLISSPAVAVTPTTPTVAANADSPTARPETKLEEQGGEGATPTYLRIDQLVANPKQPRQTFPDQEIAELATSIKRHGVLQPILVRPSQAAGLYEIIAGERRFRSAQRAELTQVPVIIKALSDRETLEISIVENVQRQNLNPVEEGQAYQRLIEEFSLAAQDVAERVGKDRATVVNAVRVLRLPDAVLEMLRSGAISVGHAKAILTVKEPSAQINLAKKVEAESLSVRALESIVARTVVLEPPKQPTVQGSKETAVKQVPHVSMLPEIEDRLRNALGTKVTLRHSRRGKGVIELHYFSDQELERLVDLLSPRA